MIKQALTSVDFLPTVLSLMNIPTADKEQGCGASELFLDATKESEWKDIASMRSTYNGKPTGSIWLSVLTDRYKLIFSSDKKPWLFDLEKDPNELVNQYANPEYSKTISRLVKGLRQYALDNNDGFIKNPNIKAGIDRAKSL